MLPDDLGTGQDGERYYPVENCLALMDLVSLDEKGSPLAATSWARYSVRMETYQDLCKFFLVHWALKK